MTERESDMLGIIDTKLDKVITDIAVMKSAGCDPATDLRKDNETAHVRIHKRLDNLKLLTSVITAAIAGLVLALKIL